MLLAKRVVIVCAAMLLGIGCKTTDRGGDDSGIKALTLYGPEAHSTQARIAHVRDELGFSKRLAGQPAGMQERLFHYLAAIPDDYLKFLLSKPNYRINFYPLGRIPGQEGNPNIAGNAPGGQFDLNPVSLNVVATEFGMREAVIHETGHSLQAYILTKNGYPVPVYRGTLQDPSIILYQQLQLALRDPVESRNLAEYPKTNYQEYFAELFHQYYASQESYDLMKRNYPSSFAFAKKFLLPSPYGYGGEVPADTATPGGDQPTTQPEVQPVVQPEQPAASDPTSTTADDDGDGVANAYDHCSNTPRGAAAWRSGQFAGCSGGQSADR